MTRTPNTDLLYRTLDAVLAADTAGTWYQGSWIDVVQPYVADEHMCGTTACFAGHTLLTLGGHILTRRNSGCSDFDCSCDVEPFIEAYGVMMPGNILVTACEVEEEARLALGLGREEASALFHSDNSLEQLKAIVDEIAASR